MDENPEIRALRDIISEQDLVITSLKAHIIGTHNCFRQTLESIILNFSSESINACAKKMIESLNQSEAEIMKLGVKNAATKN